MLIPARSISLRAAGILIPGVKGRVLASFERVCDLVTDGGAVVALVWGGVDDGPLNVVLARKPGVALPADTRFAVERRDRASNLRINPDDRVAVDAPIFLVLASPGNALPLQVDLSSAVSWDPRPDWEALRARRDRIAAGAAVIRELLKTDAARRPATGLIDQSPWRGIDDLSAVMRTGQALADADHAGDWETLATTVSVLCGLGPGLTPAGDDWLAGWLLAARLAPETDRFRKPVRSRHPDCRHPHHRAQPGLSGLHGCRRGGSELACPARRAGQRSDAGADPGSDRNHPGARRHFRPRDALRVPGCEMDLSHG